MPANPSQLPTPTGTRELEAAPALFFAGHGGSSNYVSMGPWTSVSAAAAFSFVSPAFHCSHLSASVWDTLALATQSLGNNVYCCSAGLSVVRVCSCKFQNRLLPEQLLLPCIQLVLPVRLNLFRRAASHAFCNLIPAARILGHRQSEKLVLLC